ncbi:transcriptional repressor [Pelomyxa schiedti]|nr:transcriptional repressor [Pelomyxa schiedti]
MYPQQQQQQQHTEPTQKRRRHDGLGENMPMQPPIIANSWGSDDLWRDNSGESPPFLPNNNTISSAPPPSPTVSNFLAMQQLAQMVQGLTPSTPSFSMQQMQSLSQPHPNQFQANLSPPLQSLPPPPPPPLNPPQSNNSQTAMMALAQVLQRAQSQQQDVTPQQINMLLSALSSPQVQATPPASATQPSPPPSSRSLASSYPSPTPTPTPHTLHTSSSSATSLPIPPSPAPVQSPSPTSEQALPFQPAMSALQQILNTITSKVKIFSAALEQIKSTQKNILELTPSECALNLDTLSRQHKELYDALVQEHNTILRLFDEVILAPCEIFHWKKVELQLQKCLKQLDLFQLELMHYVRPDSVACPASLIILDQPFPRSIVKGQMVPIEAQLLLPSKMDIRSMSRVTADVVQYHSTSKKNGKPSGPFIENASEDLDAEGKVHLQLRFPIGTNKKPVTLRLHVNIKYGALKCHNQALSQPGTKLVESNQSRPFIITTNSIQWRDSEGILLKMEAFGEMMEISWSKFANTLQTYYLAATRQHCEFPARPLTLKDFEYLSAIKFDQAKTISLTAYDRFWEWFGPGLEKIRHQKNMCPMWVKGYIYGLISKEDCQALLTNNEDGTFVVRLSDRFAGKYATAYVYQGEVHHSLVKDTDVAGNKRTLIDFLHEVDNMTTLLQYKADFSGKIQLSSIPKEDVLREFFTEKQEAKTPGYEDLPKITTHRTTTTTTYTTASPSSTSDGESPSGL